MQRKYRLKGQKCFSFLFSKGKSRNNKALVLIYAPSKFETPRVGFVVSKKIGKAVVRNKVRRRLREAFRSLIPGVKPFTNYVIIARSGIEKLDFNKIKASLQDALNKEGLLNAKYK